MTATHLDHIALLVPSASASASRFTERQLPADEAEDFPGEGTREVYVGPSGADGRILLMEAIGPGPYQSALERRGPGLHHVGVRVPDVAAFVNALAGSGWLLHTATLAAHAHHGTAWLARPGVPALIEVTGSQSGASSDVFVTRLTLPISPRLIDALGCPALVAGDATRMQIGEWEFGPDDI